MAKWFFDIAEGILFLFLGNHFFGFGFGFSDAFFFDRRRFLLGSFFGQFLEAVDAAGGAHDLLLAGINRVASAANFHFHLFNG